MKLYHITTDIYDPATKLFIPRVPESAAEDEDHVTPRICLSTSVANCFIAAYGNALAVGRILRIYETEITKDNYQNFIPPIVLYKRGLVFDALRNQECWCLVPLEMSSKLFVVYDFVSEHAINWSCVTLERMRKIAEKYVPTIEHVVYDSTSSEMMFHSATGWLEQHGKYDESDNLYEDVVSDYHCQSYLISDLQLHEIPDNYAHIERDSYNPSQYYDSLRRYFYEHP